MIQCFAKVDEEIPVKDDNSPRVVYACRTENKEATRALHSHENILEVMLIARGQGVFVVDGQRYNIKEGDMIVINPGVIHEEISDPIDRLSHYCIAMKGVSIEGLPGGHLLKEGRTPVYSFKKRVPFYKDIFYNVYDQLFYDRPFAQTITNSLAQSLICLLIQDMGSGSPRETETDALVDRAKKYLEANFQEDVTLTDVAKALNISTYYLSRKFKEHAGYSLNQYLTHLRIGEAQNLLIHTDHSITTVANMVGIDNSSYFNSIFTKIVGTQPSKFRALTRKKEK